MSNFPSIDDGNGTVRRVWKNRVIAESDSFIAEDLQEQEILENRNYVAQLREAETAGYRVAKQLQEEEAARLRQQRSNLDENAIRDAEIAQQLLREEALAIQRQRDEEAKRSAEAVRAAMAEEYRAAQAAKNAGTPPLPGAVVAQRAVPPLPERQGSTGSIGSSGGGIPPTSRSGSSASLTSSGSLPSSPAPSANSPPPYNAPPPMSRGASTTSVTSNTNVNAGGNVSVSSSTFVRSDSNISYDGRGVVAAPPAGNRAAPSAGSLRFLVAVGDGKSNKDILIKNQKFQDSYIMDLRKWKDKSHGILIDADSKQAAMEIRLLKDSKPKTYHFLRGTELAGMVVRQPKKATKIELILGPGVKWVFEGDFNNMFLTVATPDLIPVGKVLGKQPAADGKGQTYVVEVFDVLSSPLLLSMCVLLNVAELFKD